MDVKADITMCYVYLTLMYIVIVKCSMFTIYIYAYYSQLLVLQCNVTNA